MRKILTLLFTLSLCVTAVAQNANYQKAVARYKNHQVTATAVKTTHRAAVSKDQVTRGTLTMRQPAEVGIVMEGGQDALLMRGSEFTMTQKGKKHTTSSKSNPQFATFQAVFESILSGGAKDISRLSDLTMRQNGDQLVLTITPQATDDVHIVCAHHQHPHLATAVTAHEREGRQLHRIHFLQLPVQVRSADLRL